MVYLRACSIDRYRPNGWNYNTCCDCTLFCYQPDDVGGALSHSLVGAVQQQDALGWSIYMPILYIGHMAGTIIPVATARNFGITRECGGRIYIHLLGQCNATGRCSSLL